MAALLVAACHCPGRHPSLHRSLHACELQSISMTVLLLVCYLCAQCVAVVCAYMLGCSVACLLWVCMLVICPPCSACSSCAVRLAAKAVFADVVLLLAHGPWCCPVRAALP
jgi:hypothetical protein